MTTQHRDDVSALSGSFVGGCAAHGPNCQINKILVAYTPTVQHSILNTILANKTDTNAGTSCLGSNFAVIQFTNWSATAAPFHGDYQVIQDVPVVSGAIVYKNPITGDSILLIFHIFKDLHYNA
jgi:hypothetical protein